MQGTRVFVYGSLKSGFRHASVVARAVRVGPAEARPFTLVRYGEYPAMVATDEGSVYGELLLVDEQLLRRLDAFEDCPTLYQRRQITLADGQPAFAYLIGRDTAQGYEPIEGGVWLEVG